MENKSTLTQGDLIIIEDLIWEWLAKNYAKNGMWYHSADHTEEEVRKVLAKIGLMYGG